MIASPFYEDFSILVLQPHEMAAEKLRTTAQRARPTDLADLAVMLQRPDIADADVARVARTKFEVVKQGMSNRAARVENNLTAIGAEYDDVVPAGFPAAPSYSDATQIAWPRIKDLIPPDHARSRPPSSPRCHCDGCRVGFSAPKRVVRRDLTKIFRGKAAEAVSKGHAQDPAASIGR